MVKGGNDVDERKDVKYKSKGETISWLNGSNWIFNGYFHNEQQHPL